MGYLKWNISFITSVVSFTCVSVSLCFFISKLSNVYTPKFESNQIEIFDDTLLGVERITDIQKDCGDLCNTSRLGTKGPFFDHIKSKFSCRKIFENSKLDEPHGLPHAPKSIPYFMRSHFTMQNRIRIEYKYFDQTYLNTKSKTPVWPENLINDWIELGIQGKLKGTYGFDETNALRQGLMHAPGIKNGRILVIGSEYPWVEALCLGLGAKEVVTLEYGEIKSFHPKIKTILPKDFRLQYLNATLGYFDAVVTFSSVEHSGLGRYGDALNPWGDIIAVAKAWCVTVPDGSLTIGVMYNYDQEFLRFNADRWYGNIRYPYLTTNWKQIYRGNGNQKVHVLTKEQQPRAQ